MNYAPILVLLGGVIAMCIVGKVLVSLIGCPCQFCDNRKITPFKKLPLDLQRNILDYFREYERREPDTSAVFACQECRTVFDDFSGEKRSMDTDVDHTRLSGDKGHYTCKAYCKVCSSLMSGCDPDVNEIKCPRCGTAYVWNTHEKSRFRFLRPPPDAELLESIGYDSGVA